MERLVRLEVQLILRLEPCSRNIIHARPERVRSRLFFIFFLETREYTKHTEGQEVGGRTPFWNCASRSRLRRSNSPDFLNLRGF